MRSVVFDLVMLQQSIKKSQCILHVNKKQIRSNLWLYIYISFIPFVLYRLNQVAPSGRSFVDERQTSMPAELAPFRIDEDKRQWFKIPPSLYGNCTTGHHAVSSLIELNKSAHPYYEFVPVELPLTPMNYDLSVTALWGPMRMVGVCIAKADRGWATVRRLVHVCLYVGAGERELGRGGYVRPASSRANPCGHKRKLMMTLQEIMVNANWSWWLTKQPRASSVSTWYHGNSHETNTSVFKHLRNFAKTRNEAEVVGRR